LLTPVSVALVSLSVPAKDPMFDKVALPAMSSRPTP